MYTRPVLAVTLLGLSAASQALEVTACASDSQTGAGTNLQQAIAAAGTVSFRCPPGARLLVVGTHAVTADTIIDGGNAVTLVVRLGGGPALAVGNSRLTLTRMRLEGETRVPIGRTPGITTLMVSGSGSAEFRNVVAHRLDRPLFVLQNGRAVIVESTFSDGPDPIRITGNGQLEIRGGQFERMPSAVFADGGHVMIAGTRFLSSRLVMNNCEFLIEDASFRDNDARPTNASGGAIDTDCSGRVTRTLFQNNWAVNGGAVNLRALYKPVEFQRVRFISNHASADGGAIHRETYLAVRGRPATPLKLRYSVFRENFATRGGGFYIGSGVIDGYALHFAGNAASADGGGAYTRALRLTRGTFIRNRAGQSGGAIYAYIASHPFRNLVTTTLANILIAQNEAPKGAGIYGSAVRLVNSTIADNTGPGVDAGDSAVSPAITLTNTLIATNTGGECRGSLPTSFALDGPNLQFPSASCPGVPVGDPYLDPVYAPVLGSPALGAADLRVCLDAPVNARDAIGEPRPQGRGCSLGAIEGAVERQVWDRLTRRQEIPGDLIDEIRELARRLIP